MPRAILFFVAVMAFTGCAPEQLPKPSVQPTSAKATPESLDRALTILETKDDALELLQMQASQLNGLSLVRSTNKIQTLWHPIVEDNPVVGLEQIESEQFDDELLRWNKSELTVESVEVELKEVESLENPLIGMVAVSINSYVYHQGVAPKASAANESRKFLGKLVYLGIFDWNGVDWKLRRVAVDIGGDPWPFYRQNFDADNPHGTAYVSGYVGGWPVAD